MSAAISRLHIEEPPATVHSYGSCFARMWRVRCEECGAMTLARPLLSVCLIEQREHAAIHAYDQRITEAERKTAERRAVAALERGAA